MEQNGVLYLSSDESIFSDTNYRYKISPIDIAYVNKKGTKITVITNLKQFAKDLMFDETILIKLIGKKLSAKSGQLKNTGDFYIQGEYPNEDIKNIVYGFIKTYLLCSLCDKPEVAIKCKKQKIKQTCKACGNNCYINNSDINIDCLLSKFVNK